MASLSDERPPIRTLFLRALQLYQHHLLRFLPTQFAAVDILARRGYSQPGTVNRLGATLRINVQTVAIVIAANSYMLVALILAVIAALFFSRCSIGLVGLSGSSCPPGGESPLVAIAPLVY
jgi:hypothetical protein